MGSGFDEEGDAPAKRPGITKIRKRSEARPGGGARATMPQDEPAQGDPALPPAPAAEKPGATVAESSANLQAGLVVGRLQELQAEEEKLRVTRGKLAATYKLQVAQRAGGDTALRSDLARIVETAWVEDMEKVWTKLKANLRLGVKRRSHSALSRALDDARQIQFEASSLHATARREKKRWEAENEVAHGAMWNAGNQVCQAEKDTGLRNKAITDGDVKAMAATLFPDEWVEIETKRADLDLTVDLIGKLATAAGERAEDLRVLLSKHRG